MTFTQTLSSKIDVNAVAGTPHCGVANGAVSFPVTVEIRYHADAKLDSNGFLLDNVLVRDYFKAFNGTNLRVSCEHLLTVILHDVTDMLHSKGLQFVSVKVELTPIAGAAVISAETHWTTVRSQAIRKPDSEIPNSMRPDDFMIRDLWNGWDGLGHA